MVVKIIDYFYMENLVQWFQLYTGPIKIVYDTLDKYLFSPLDIDDIDKQNISVKLLHQIIDDIDALIERDPAARKYINGEEKDPEEDRKYVMASYKSLLAVMMYRIAHFIFYYDETNIPTDSLDEEDLVRIKNIIRTQARQLSENTKVSTSVEIHPTAKIGNRFVVDHGYGTVIGETCVIGDNCYILQGVTLGSSGVAGNDEGARHPIIGDNVEIAGCARVFGKVRVGSDTLINGYAIVRENIPENCIVNVVNQIQITKPKNRLSRKAQPKLSIYGVIPTEKGFNILGKGLLQCHKIELLTDEGLEIDSVSVQFEVEDNCLACCINNIESILNKENLKGFMISLSVNTQNIILLHSAGWDDYINSIKN